MSELLTYFACVCVLLLFCVCAVNHKENLTGHDLFVTFLKDTMDADNMSSSHIKSTEMYTYV